MAVSTIDDRRAVYDRTTDRSREAFTLAAANIAASPVIVTGGTYLLDASATAFGEIRIEMQRGDGIWTSLASVTATDRPIEIRMPANALIRAVLTATTGARAILSRVPA